MPGAISKEPVNVFVIDSHGKTITDLITLSCPMTGHSLGTLRREKQIPRFTTHKLKKALGAPFAQDDTRSWETWLCNPQR